MALKLQRDFPVEPPWFVEFVTNLSHPKRRKALLATLKSAEVSGDFSALLESWLRRKFMGKNFDVLKKVSLLLHLDAVTVKVLESEFLALCTYIKHVLSEVWDQIDERIGFVDSNEFNEICMQAVKVCLQIVQVFPSKILQLSETFLKDILKGIFELVVCIFVHKKTTKECSLLAGTIIALMFNLVKDAENIVGSLHKFVLYTAFNSSTTTCTLVFGELSIPCSLQVTSIYSQMSFFMALLNTKSKILLKKLACLPYIHTLFAIVSNCCSEAVDSALRFLAFKTLHSWLIFTRHVGLIELIAFHASNSLFLNQHSLYLNALVKLANCHKDDLIDGIPSNIQKVFALTLKSHQEERLLQEDNSNQFVLDLLESVAKQPWKMKGRWVLMCEILPYVGYKMFFSEVPAIKQELVDSMATNSLPNVANDFYKTILKDMRHASDEEFVTEWCFYVKDFVWAAITHKSHSVQESVGQYWLPSTFSILPSAFHILEEYFECQQTEKNDHGYIILLKSARQHGVFTSQDLIKKKPFFEECLESFSLEVRFGTFDIICSNPKSTEPLDNSFHFPLLKFIKSNLNCTSSKYRQQMISSLKKLLHNVRECCVIYYKRCKKAISLNVHQGTVNNLIDFVEDIVEIARACLSPSSRFQRRKAGLLLVEVLSDLFIFVEKREHQKKGGPAASSKDFFKNLQCAEPKKWNIQNTFTEDLLFCIEDEHDEIRNLALDVLLRHQDLSLRDEYLTSRSSMSRVLNTAFALLNMTKPSAVESGATFLKFVVFRMIANPSLSLASDIATTGNPTNPFQLCDHMLHCCQSHWNEAKEDFLYAARVQPLHGWVLALAECFSSVASSANQQVNFFVSTSIRQFSAVSRTLLQLLAGTEDLFDEKWHKISPSFADINEAFDATLISCASYTSTVRHLTHEHCRELLLAFCWHNIKAIGLYFATLIEGNFIAGNLDEVKTILEFYCNSLIKCHHKGIIEANSACFSKVTKSLAVHPLFWSELSSCCLTVMRLCTDVTNSISVSTRSSGLPMFIVSIIESEPSSERSLLFNTCVKHLTHVASTPAKFAEDSSQFNALFILKSIFKDAALGAHAQRVVTVTMKGFSSPSWSVRNACVQLFGVLVPRLLGQHVNQEGGATGVDVFFYRYPCLFGCFDESLQCGDVAQVVPALTLLSKLRPAADMKVERYESILTSLEKLKSSPVFVVRGLTCDAIIALTEPDRHLSMCDELCADVLETRCQNRRHCDVLLLHKLILHSINSDVYVKIMSVLSRLLPKIRCFNSLIQSILLDTLVECGLENKTVSEQIVFVLNEIMSINSNRTIDPVRPYLVNSLAKALVYAFTCKTMESETSSTILALISGDVDLLASFFEYLSTRVYENQSIEGLAIRVLHATNNRRLLTAILEYAKQTSSISRNGLFAIRLKEIYYRFPYLTAHALPLLRNFDEVIDDVTDIIDSFSACTQVEDLRVSAARSLDILEKLFNCLPKFNYNVSRLLSCSLRLLQDEDEQVRSAATLSLQFLNKNPRRPLHCHITLANLFSFVGRCSVENPFLLDWLIEQLVAPSKRSECNPSVLFDADDNVFAEEIVVVDHSSHMLQLFLLDNTTRPHCDEIEKCVQHLHDVILEKTSQTRSAFGYRENVVEVCRFIEALKLLALLHASNERVKRGVAVLSQLNRTVNIPSEIKKRILRITCG